MITTILNVYNRPHLIEQQIEAIQKQTIESDIWVWVNQSEKNRDFDFSKLTCRVVHSNHNFKFHGRFALGLLAQTEFVAFFDDDTIPGHRWFENCLNTIKDGEDGILGSAGILLNQGDYQNHTKIGHNNGGNEKVIQVDLVGHSWFLKKDYLRYLWYDEPHSWDNGEDMQLSFQAQKFGSIKTYVPRHPLSDLSLWGSLPELYHGDDENASFKVLKSHQSVRDDIVSYQLANGWIPARGRKHLRINDTKNYLRLNHPSFFAKLKSLKGEF